MEIKIIPHTKVCQLFAPILICQWTTFYYYWTASISRNRYGCPVLVMCLSIESDDFILLMLVRAVTQYITATSTHSVLLRPGFTYATSSSLISNLILSIITSGTNLPQHNCKKLEALVFFTGPCWGAVRMVRVCTRWKLIWRIWAWRAWRLPRRWPDGGLSEGYGHDGPPTGHRPDRRLSEGYGHDGPGVCTGDGQTEA